MTDTAIRVEKLGKQYRIGRAQERHDTLRDAIGATFRRSHVARSNELIWALKDVSFEVQRGEVVGIIGRNGAGKSTLLKILSRITEPTEGRAEIHGRVGSLLEVGTGFHPELTGRENIYLSGAVLGMHREEIDRKFDEIVDFSGVGQFLDTPIKRYSSGMNVRLGFAVAAHLEPEILLVDEVLAVGDYEFQQRCLGKMDDIAREGRTVVFVSHNLAAIGNLTQTCFVFEAGRMAFCGESSAAIQFYLARERDLVVNVFRPESAAEPEVDGARIVDVCLSTDVPRTGQPLGITVCIERPTGASAVDCDVSVSFLTLESFRVLQLYSSHMGEPLSIGPGITRIESRVESLPLVAGSYKVNVWLGTGSAPIHWLQDCMTLRVEQGTLNGIRFVEARGYPAVVASSWLVS
jgi:lipopolysaccharide transport system ATP-binding protein